MDVTEEMMRRGELGKSGGEAMGKAWVLGDARLQYLCLLCSSKAFC